MTEKASQHVMMRIPESSTKIDHHENTLRYFARHTTQYTLQVTVGKCELMSLGVS
jgi:hypothetical protein